MFDTRGGVVRWTIVLGFVLICGLIGLVPGLFAVAAPHAQIPSAHSRRPLGNPIVTENALPGTDEWASIGNYDITRLAAYPGATSVNAGGPISIYAKGTGTSLSARLYRLGYYQNHGARLITTYSGISLSSQPNCTRISSTGLVRCPWSPAFTINTNSSWVSGVYLLRMDSSDGYRFFVYFIVRNDSSSADFLFVEASKTNQAYNGYGGESLYNSYNNEGRARAYQVSFDRPYNSGAGTGSFFTHDVDMVRWVEASGYDVTYISDVDQAINPNFMQGHTVLLEVGHPEYWSWNERDNVDAALAAGKHMVFASANVSWWNVRLEPSSVGPNRVITCYKDETLDPTPVPPYVTVEFDGPILQRPENQLTGVNYQSYADDAVYNAPWVLTAPPTKWYFDCTGLQAGDRVNNVIGEEWDAVVNNGRSPSGMDILSQSTVIGPQGMQTLANSVIFTTTNGAKVFSAGSIHWSWGLIDHSYPNQVFESYAVSNDADHRTEQLMANIFDDFAGYWDGAPRGCGSGNQTFYDIGSRATRTPKPQVATATGTRPTSTGTRPPYATLTPTSTPTLGRTNTATITRTPTRTPTRTYTPTPPSATTPTPTFTSDSLLVGHVVWQGHRPQPDVLQQMPITLALTTGATEVDYPSQITDQNGYFSAPVGGLPNGTYTWRVKGPQYLSNSGTVALFGDPSTSVEMGLMLVGDANNDNAVSVLDFTVLSPTLGRSINDPGYDPRADFTGDQRVDVSDFNWIRINFSLRGR